VPRKISGGIVTFVQATPLSTGQLTTIVVAALLGVSACSEGSEHSSPRLVGELQQITAQQWQRLSERAIYFGHQSVGENILDGIRALGVEMPQLKDLRILSAASDPSAAGLREFPIGENGDPGSKNAAFMGATQGALGPKPVLMFKYCYVDIDEKTDPRMLFRRYAETVAALRARHPDAIVVHMTMPLTTDSQIRNWVNTLRGRPNRRTWNGIRSRYNDLLRAAYGGKEPIFDLAALESTRSDGSLELGTVAGEPVYALADEWTSDGGHLNAAGRRRAAAHLLALLASLPESNTESIAKVKR
jgi:hypothetical protein